MKNLSEAGVSEEIVNRLNSLSQNSAPGWGKMNVSQMLVHCRIPIENALGRQKLSRSFIGRLFGGIAKKSILKDEPFKQNLPTDKRFIIANTGGFEEERKNLTSTIQQFVQTFPGGITTDPHPFFGKMTSDEWGILMWKHLDHHLRQFGA